MMNHSLDQTAAIKETLPTAFGYIGIGLAFGVLATTQGLQPLWVLALSAFVYAGSAQFIIISMLATKSPILSIVLAVFLVNARMILMSMTTAPYFKRESLTKNILLGTFLTDESFALAMNKLNYTDNRLNYTWLHTVNVMAYFIWVSSSFVGALLGNMISNPSALGLDFAVVAMFIGLLYLQIISDKSMPLRLQVWVVLATFILVYLGLIFLPSNLVIIIVTLLGCGIGVFLKHVFF